MNKQKWYKADLEFSLNEKSFSFSVIHNLNDVQGMSIKDAFTNWVARTKSFTDISLCKYVMSKDESFVCLTQKQYDRLNK